MLISTLSVLAITSSLYSLYKLSDFEFPLLILLSLLGLFFLVSSANLLSMYLSVETLSLSLYVLAAIRKDNSFSTEAGLKYFLLGALSSCLLLFGSVLIFFSTGLLDFHSLSSFLVSSNVSHHALLIGVFFLLFAILFKLAAAPFHM